MGGCKTTREVAQSVNINVSCVRVLLLIILHQLTQGLVYFPLVTESTSFGAQLHASPVKLNGRVCQR